MKSTASHLVPWNLFFSASSFERPDEMSWQAVEDFSGLVDHFCLNHKLIVLGDPHHRLFLTHDTEFFSAIRDSDAVEVWGSRNHPNVDEKTIVTSAKDHVRSLFHETPTDLIDEWIDRALSVNEVPTSLEDRALMNASVRLDPPQVLRFPSIESLGSSLLKHDADPKLREFVLRTMIYVAYADHAGIPWAADSLRRPLMEVLLSEERRLLLKGFSQIERLKHEMHAAWEADASYTPEEATSRRRISPFAGIIFARCRGDVKRIPDEMFRLRFDLRDFRQNLIEIDEQIRAAPTHSEEMRARQAWLGVLKQVHQKYGPGLEGGTVTWDRTLAPAKTTLKFFTGTAGPSEYLDSAKHVLEAIGALLRRRRFVQLFRLSHELPGSGRLYAFLEEFFPKHFHNGRWLHLKDQQQG